MYEEKMKFAVFLSYWLIPIVFLKQVNTAM